MSGIKVYISDDVEGEFREVAMRVFGYGRGSISKAAEQAFKKWILANKWALKDLEVPEDPVKAIRGMLKHVDKTSVELQHEASRMRVRRALEG